MSTEVVVFREGQEAVRIRGLYSPGLRTCSPTDLLSDVARQTVFAEIPALAVIEDHSGALVSIIRERDLVGGARVRGGCRFGHAPRLRCRPARRASIPRWWQPGCLMPVYGTCR